MLSDALAAFPRSLRLPGILVLSMLGLLWVGAVSAQTLTLSQEEDENDVNTSHTVLATTADTTAGVGVEFEVITGPNEGTDGTCGPNTDCTTDSTFSVSFTYMGDGGPGVDMIRAFFVQGETDTVFSNVLEKTWLPVNMPPVALCEDKTVSTGPEDCVADVSIDAGSFDPDEGDTISIVQEPPGPYPLGDTVVDLIVTDLAGAADTCTATVTVVDDVAPEIAVCLSHDMLWPPNHKLVEVCADVSVDDNCGDVTWELVSVTSSEPDNQKKGGGDGNTNDDIQGVDGGSDGCVLLRAERRGPGDGRVYTLEFTATDGSGNTASATACVWVPHDQSSTENPCACETDEGDGEDGEDDSSGTDLTTGGNPWDSGEEVWVNVFDVQGRQISRFPLDRASGSEWTLGWDGRTSTGRSAPNGIYFYKITTSKQQYLRRVVIMR